MNGCESWTVKKAEHQRIDAFELWCWRRLLRVHWTARRSNQSILKEINSEYLLEGLTLKLKFQYFGHLMWSWLIRKDPDAGKDWVQEERGMTKDEMVGWHHWLDGLEFEQAPEVGDGQESLVCYSPWGWKESDTTEQLNWKSGLNLDIFWKLEPKEFADVQIWGMTERKQSGDTAFFEFEPLEEQCYRYWCGEDSNQQRVVGKSSVLDIWMKVPIRH